MKNKTRCEHAQSDLPDAWHNTAADTPIPPTPVLNPRARQPVN